MSFGRRKGGLEAGKDRRREGNLKFHSLTQS
jgi:hypothetical protein